MNFEFTENTVINIPLTYKGYRLDEGEKVRFRCCFKNYEGDFPYTLDMEEDNKGEAGSDGKFTVTLDMGRYGISPGRYDFDLSLVLESGSLITLMSKNDNHINITPAAEGLDKPNGEVFFGADFIVEEGKIGKWNYLKRNSGYAECWGTVTYELSKDVYKLDSNGAHSVASGILALPAQLFAEIDAINVSPLYYYQTGASAKMKTKSSVEVNLFCGTNNMSSMKAGAQVDVSCVVKGKWK